MSARSTMSLQASPELIEDVPLRNVPIDSGPASSIQGKKKLAIAVRSIVRS